MVKESDKQTQNKLQAFCKQIKREALIYKASRNFHTIQTPDRQYGVLTHIDDFKGFLTS